jgi:hypothetical protein
VPGTHLLNSYWICRVLRLEGAVADTIIFDRAKEDIAALAVDSVRAIRQETWASLRCYDHASITVFAIRSTAAAISAAFILL